MKNWKTTSTGITMIVGAVIGVYFAYKNNQINEATLTTAITAFLGGVGLLCSKDYNVTGGTTLNVPNDASVVKEATKVDSPKL